GYFFLVDRRRDVIIRAGYTVYPRQVEEVLYEHPAVRQATVVGFPHPEVGEEIGAVVVLRDSASEDELRRWVRERVAAYQYPRRVRFVYELPTGPADEVLKRELGSSLLAPGWAPGRAADGGAPGLPPGPFAP